MVIIEVKTLAPETYYEKSTQAGRKTASGIFAPAAVKHSYKLGSAAQDLCRKNRFGGSKTASGVRHYYYNDQWKAVEERLDAETTADRQYAWGIQYRNDLILRDRDTTGNGTLDERLYATHDALGNCTAILNTSGAVQERYGYSAFGVRRIMQADFSARASSSFAWDFGFQGEFLDDETGYINYGYRSYLPYLGRWVNRDPIAEDGGNNLYGFVGNDAVNKVDRLGLFCCLEEPLASEYKTKRDELKSLLRQFTAAGVAMWQWEDNDGFFWRKNHPFHESVFKAAERSLSAQSTIAAEELAGLYSHYCCLQDGGKLVPWWKDNEFDSAASCMKPVEDFVSSNAGQVFSGVVGAAVVAGVAASPVAPAAPAAGIAAGALVDDALLRYASAKCNKMVCSKN